MRERLNMIAFKRHLELDKTDEKENTAFEKLWHYANEVTKQLAMVETPREPFRWDYETEGSWTTDTNEHWSEFDTRLMEDFAVDAFKIYRFGQPGKSFIDCRNRKKEVVAARNVMFMILMSNGKYTTSEVAKRYGDMDHSTVIHAKKSIAGILSNPSDIFHKATVDCLNKAMCLQDVLRMVKPYMFVRYEHRKSVPFKHTKFE